MKARTARLAWLATLLGCSGPVALHMPPGSAAELAPGRGVVVLELVAPDRCIDEEFEGGTRVVCFSALRDSRIEVRSLRSSERFELAADSRAPLVFSLPEGEWILHALYGPHGSARFEERYAFRARAGAVNNWGVLTFTEPETRARARWEPNEDAARKHLAKHSPALKLPFETPRLP